MLHTSVHHSLHNPLSSSSRLLSPSAHQIFPAQAKMFSILFLVPVLTLLLPAVVSHRPPHPARGQATGWWQQRNYNTIFSIYNTTIYPNNQAFLTEGVSALPSNLFSPDATGRITPIGNFSGLADSVEYFFGLTPPAAPPLYDTWTSAQLAHFTSGCPEVAASVVYGGTTGINSSFTATYNQTVTTIKQVAFWRFDDQGRVMNYDAWLPSLESYTALVFGTDSTNTTLQEATISSLCESTQELVSLYGPNMSLPARKWQHATQLALLPPFLPLLTHGSAQETIPSTVASTIAKAR